MSQATILDVVKVGESHGSRRKSDYIDMSKGCSMYDPCPITYKCMNKASHLYQRCIECPIPMATSNHKQRAFMIRRENFALTLTPETEKAIGAWLDNREANEGGDNQ
jgi:hypothetical protein